MKPSESTSLTKYTKLIYDRRDASLFKYLTWDGRQLYTLTYCAVKVTSHRRAVATFPLCFGRSRLTLITQGWEEHLLWAIVLEWKTAGKTTNKSYYQQHGKTHSISRHVLTESGLSVFFLVNLSFYSGWKEFTQLSGYYYNFDGLKVYKIFELCFNDIIHDLYSTGV